MLFCVDLLGLNYVSGKSDAFCPIVHVIAGKAVPKKEIPDSYSVQMRNTLAGESYRDIHVVPCEAP